jgi:hypothetical protein
VQQRAAFQQQAQAAASGPGGSGGSSSGSGGSGGRSGGSSGSGSSGGSSGGSGGSSGSSGMAGGSALATKSAKAKPPRVLVPPELDEALSRGDLAALQAGAATYQARRKKNTRQCRLSYPRRDRDVRHYFFFNWLYSLHHLF